MRRLRTEEDGIVAVIAIVLLAIMLMLGLAMMSGLDTGTKRTRNQRELDTAFNLTEGVLYAQSFNLAQQWPSGQNPDYPAKCQATIAPTGNGVFQCPNAAKISGTTSSNFTGKDFTRGVDWATRVRDNYGALASSYDPTAADQSLTGALGTCAYPCSKDFNGDRQIWVQARATAENEPHSVVALMKLETLQESMPHVAIASGAIAVTNNGNHNSTFLVDGTGSDIMVRCTPEAAGTPNASCTSYQPGQVTPSPKPNAPTQLMSNAEIQRFAETAKVNGTYYTTCPPDNLQGAVIFVEYCDPATSAGSYQGQGPSTACGANLPAGMQAPCKNSLSSPGLLIFRCGGMSATSNWTYVGIIYFANNIDGKCPLGARGNGKCNGQNINGNDVFQSNGGFGVWGVIAAEGGACMKFGSNNFQFKYDAAVFDSMTSYGTVGLVQNTWRELTAGHSF